MYYDYGFILAVLSLVSGVIWLLDIYLLKPKRMAAAENYRNAADKVDQETLENIKQEPFYVDYARSFFPVLLFIFVFRAFFYEPFRIPSGSMMPTLLIGDFILVNKFTYGVRLPITHKKVMEMDSPKRGDVLVFKNPVNPKQDYIKRVIGLPGDIVFYDGNKGLKIRPSCDNAISKIEGKCDEIIEIEAQQNNGAAMSYYQEYTDSYRDLAILDEQLGEAEHQILHDGLSNEADRVMAYRGNYSLGKGVWKVPENHYFVLGDNRDNSQDSRYWGFVPEELVVGKAVAVWMHIGLTEKPVLGSWRLPNSIKFGRIGGIE
ncbi:MAG: signal peptidase I [Pseudomonadota bacterium]